MDGRAAIAEFIEVADATRQRAADTVALLEQLQTICRMMAIARDRVPAEQWDDFERTISQARAKAQAHLQLVDQALTNIRAAVTLASSVAPSHLM